MLLGIAGDHQGESPASGNVAGGAEAVLNGTDTPVTGFDGLLPVKIAMAAAKSLKEGRPVKLDEIG